METKKQLQERYKKIERKIKRVMRGCGDTCERGGTCWHLSRKEQLLFNKDLTDSKIAKVRVYCENCRIEIFELRAQLRLLKEILEVPNSSQA